MLPVLVTDNLYTNTYLKSITVEGSSSVSINRELGIIQITLPESYSSKSVTVNFNLGVNTSFYYNGSADQPKYTPNITIPEKQSIELNYQGIAPVDIGILNGETRDNYKIYINQTNKKLATTITLSDSIGQDFSNYFTLRSTTFQGTYPNVPFAPQSSFLLLRSKTTNLIDTTFLNHSFWNEFGSFNMRKFYPFDNQKFSVELVNNGERQILKDDFQIFSDTPVVERGYKKTNTGFELKGGIFLPSKPYSITLYNDYLKSPISINAKVKDANTLSIEIPQSVQPNGYIIEVFEGTKHIMKNLIDISETNSFAAIVAFRRVNDDLSGIYPSVKKEQFNQGETFSILPLGAFMSCYSVPISQENLDKIEAPSLKLTRDFKELEVPSKKIIVWLPRVFCSVIYFQYTIPKSTESGFYEAQLVYPDGRESLKYWNKIEIR